MPRAKLPRPSLRSTAERNALAEQHLGLAGLFAGRFHAGLTSAERNRYSWDDALADACVGLLRAAELWDAASGYAFSTYCRAWCWHFLQQGLRDALLIRVPWRKVRLAGSVGLPLAVCRG